MKKIVLALAVLCLCVLAYRAPSSGVQNPFSSLEISYDCNFGGGITAEGLVGSCGWYSDLAGGASAGSISRSSGAAPDVNHFGLLALLSGSVSGAETGTGWGYCNVTTPTTSCGAGTQATDIFPSLSTITFDSYFIFKNPAVLTSLRMSVCYGQIAITQCDQSANPKQAIGVQFDTSAGDTHWMAITGDATGGGSGHNTRTDMGVTPVASDWTCVHIFSNTVGTILFQVGDGANSSCDAIPYTLTLSPISISTTLPTAPESPWMLVTPLNTTPKTMYPIRWKFVARVDQ